MFPYVKTNCKGLGHELKNKNWILLFIKEITLIAQEQLVKIRRGQNLKMKLWLKYIDSFKE